MILNYIRQAIRLILKNKLFSVINILGLALGIASTIIIMLWATHELSYDNFFSQSENIYHVGTKSPNSNQRFAGFYTSYAVSKLLKENFPEVIYQTRVENYSFFGSCMFSTENGKNDQKQLFYEHYFHIADSTFFKIFDYPFIHGSANTAFNSLNSIVVSNITAKKYFGEKNPVGKQLILNNEKAYTVTGVVRIPSNANLSFDLIANNLTVREERYLNGWDSNGPSYIMLNSNTDPEQFQSKIAGFLDEIDSGLLEGTTIELTPVKELHTRYGLIILIVIMISIAISILIIASLNYINLSTALFSLRVKLLSITKISGASKRNIRTQVLIEAFIISTASMLVALFFVKILLPVFRRITDIPLSLMGSMSFFQIAVILILAVLVVGLLSGLFPAMRYSSVKVINLMRKEPYRLRGTTLPRRIMVIFQFIVSIFLITSTLFIFKQRKQIDQMALGFQEKYIIRIPINDKIRNNFENYRLALKNNLGVIEVTAASTVPAGIGNHSYVKWGDGPEDHMNSMKFAMVMPDYINTFGMQLAKGKSFNHTDEHGLNGYIVNEAAVKRMNLKNPIGHKVSLWGKEGEIIGVVKDFQNNFRTNELMPLILSSNKEHRNFIKYIFVRVHPNRVKEAIQYVESTTRRFAPDFPFEYSFIEEEIDGYMKDGIRFNLLFIIFSVISIFLALLGLVGLSLFTTERRVKEIGIRKANGANTNEILGLLVNEFFKCIFIAFIVSAPLVYLLMKKWLQLFAYKTSLSWWVFILSGLFATLIALISIGYQSWRAASRNPVEALRYE